MGALRSWFVAHLAKFACVGLLAVPLLTGLLPRVQMDGEQRNLAAFPPAPATVQAALAYPALAEAAINDHFSFRAAQITLNTRLRYFLFGQFPTIQVVGGRDGHLFLATHTAKGEPFRAIRLSCGDGFKDLDFTVGEVNLLEQRFRASGRAVHLLMVPTSPIVYSELLPGWMARRCAPGAAPALAVLASPMLSPAARAMSYFPLAEMRAMPPEAPAFPPHYYHWSGNGPKVAAEASELRFWQRSASVATALKLGYRMGESDVKGMFPGIQIERPVGAPELAGSGIEACIGGDCFPGHVATMNKLGMVALYRNGAPGLGPRLVLLADSFGPNVAPWFARFHVEVLLIGTNQLISLSPAERAEVRALSFRADSKDELLYVYHDVSLYSGRIGYDLNMLAP
ncbi:MAG: hypothetical protein V4508_14740 [Pseudomonadota bacterium]